MSDEGVICDDVHYLGHNSIIPFKRAELEADVVECGMKIVLLNLVCMGYRSCGDFIATRAEYGN